VATAHSGSDRTGAASSSTRQQRQSPESGGTVHPATAGPQRQRRFPEATHSGPESGARRTGPAEPHTAARTGNKSNGLLETL